MVKRRIEKDGDVPKATTVETATQTSAARPCNHRSVAITAPAARKSNSGADEHRRSPIQAEQPGSRPSHDSGKVAAQYQRVQMRTPPAHLANI